MSDGCLFLVNGDSAAGALEAAGLARAGDILVLHDVLSCGALDISPQAADLVHWLPMRKQFWSQVWDSGVRFGLVEGPFPAFMEKPRNVYAAGLAIQAARRVVLCTGAGLSDVLAQGFFVAWSEALGVDPECLQAVRLSGRDAPPAGLPLLSPSELADAWRFEPLKAANRRASKAFWQAFEAAQSTGALPPARVGVAQRAALEAWRSRHLTGDRPLAAWDARLLSAAAGETPTLKSVLGTALRAARGDHDPVGDLVLLHRLKMLTAEAPGLPLLEFGALKGLETRCALTEAGRAALAGHDDAATSERRQAWQKSLA